MRRKCSGLIRRIVRDAQRKDAFAEETLVAESFAGEFFASNILDSIIKSKRNTVECDCILLYIDIFYLDLLHYL